MKIEIEQVMAALALLALGYTLGKRRAAQDAGASGAAQSQASANSQAAWWTYAGSWV